MVVLTGIKMYHYIKWTICQYRNSFGIFYTQINIWFVSNKQEENGGWDVE